MKRGEVGKIWVGVEEAPEWAQQSTVVVGGTAEVTAHTSDESRREGNKVPGIRETRRLDRSRFIHLPGRSRRSRRAREDGLWRHGYVFECITKTEVVFHLTGPRDDRVSAGASSVQVTPQCFSTRADRLFESVASCPGPGLARVWVGGRGPHAVCL
ncbi:hypothetical protein M407DRAFT_158076 [Tulasnella calospora MUT 4182]|uniref:Uncharacterized protein n=1 Tax=Tulasnella calospora MUT 4182 TaxID=1051891 RepID=A0A0C3L8D1_9AGAM|nr:hypothetical protein M407DRAFT_158076 [Tulasnella calospora MUT 4182]